MIICNNTCCIDVYYNEWFPINLQKCLYLYNNFAFLYNSQAIWGNSKFIARTKTEILRLYLRIVYKNKFYMIN